MHKHLDTEEYMALVGNLAIDDLRTVEAYLRDDRHKIVECSKLFTQIYSTVSIEKKIYNFLSTIDTTLNWSISTELSSINCARITPYLIQMANSSDFIQVDIVMNNNPTLQSSSIDDDCSLPILTCADANWQVLFNWNPRSNTMLNNIAVDAQEQGFSNYEKQTASVVIQEQGKQAQLEIYELLKSISKN